MSGSAEAPPRIKLNVSQAGSPADEMGNTTFTWPRTRAGDPGPETEGVRETETERWGWESKKERG